MFDVFFANLPYLLKGMLITIEFAFGGIVVGTLLGVGLGILAVVFPSVVGKLIAVYVFVIRGIPVLVWMFMGYTGLGALISDFMAVLIVLILYTSAFVAEIARGAASRPFLIHTSQPLRLVLGCEPFLQVAGAKMINASQCPGLEQIMR